MGVSKAPSWTRPGSGSRAPRRATASRSATSNFKALAFYSTSVEPDHVAFAKAALDFFRGLAARERFVLDVTTDWSDMNAARLAPYQVVVWIDDFPHDEAERRAFEAYVGGGGAWLGFHVAAYNDKDTGRPWFVSFLGGGVFHSNNWPPLPAQLRVDDRTHPITRRLPASFTSPTNEWYLWQPSPRPSEDVRVLVTLDPANYPLGKKDILTAGDLPVVWTNTRYRMVYVNMGHGPEVLSDETQNGLFAAALLWLGRGAR